MPDDDARRRRQARHRGACAPANRRSPMVWCVQEVAMLVVGPFSFLHRALPLRTLSRAGPAAPLAVSALAGPALAQSSSGSAADAVSAGLILLLSILILAVVFALWKFVFRLIG